MMILGIQVHLSSLAAREHDEIESLEERTVPLTVGNAVLREIGRIAVFLYKGKDR